MVNDGAIFFSRYGKIDEKLQVARLQLIIFLIDIQFLYRFLYVHVVWNTLGYL